MLDLGDGIYTIVDSDLDSSIRYRKWTAWTNTAGKVYAKSRYRKDGKVIYVFLHRLIAEAPQHLEVDHINRNSLDNRRENLRLATRSQNGANRALQKNNKSGFRGVHRTKEGRWIATIKVQGKQQYLGTFLTAPEAAQAYDAASLVAFGPFAQMNLPEGAARS